MAAPGSPSAGTPTSTSVQEFEKRLVKAGKDVMDPVAHFGTFRYGDDAFFKKNDPPALAIAGEDLPDPSLVDT